MNWDALRRDEFAVTECWAYLDHAAVAPLPTRAGQMLRAWTEEQEQNGVVNYSTWEKRLEVVRARAAGLLNAETDEIAFVTSTTHGLGLVAEGFPWNAGDNVVTAAEEYPSNIYPWMNLADRGVTLRLVSSRDGRIWLDDLAAAIDSRTRLLTISHVEFASGFRNDLDAIGELCKARGIAFCVDAIQGLGPLQIDVKRTPIDFLAADGHKWLLGPEGAGLFFVRREWIERLRPILVGWHSVVTPYNSPRIDYRLKPSAQRWEGGSFNVPGLLALGESLSLLMEIGPRAVSERILDRAEAVREAAARSGWSVAGSTRPEDLSGIVALEREGIDPTAAAKALRARGVVVASRRGRLRVSPHVYNNADDIEQLAEGLKALEP
jgi:cysteine desulfurase / selenocysteine lyase